MPTPVPRSNHYWQTSNASSADGTSGGTEGFLERCLAVQKAVIEPRSPVRTGRIRRPASADAEGGRGLEQSYTYGVGHFIGMEVDDDGDYLEPLRTGDGLADAEADSKRAHGRF